MLLVEGCPYGFASSGVDLSFLPSGSSDWHNGLTSGSIVIGSLDPNLGNWSERIDPVEGTFEASSMTFRIHDREVTIVGATRNLGTYLFTRDNQPWSQIAASVSKAATSIQLQAPYDMFTGTNFIAWIEQEAILCSSIASDTITVASRSYLGTQAKAHNVDAGNLYYPTCYSEFPGVTKRGVKLWAQDDSGTWSVLWRGISNRAPRLSNNGAQLEIQAEHIWTTHRQEKFSTIPYKVRTAGIDPYWFGIGSNLVGGAVVRTNGSIAQSPTVPRYVNNIHVAHDLAYQRIRSYLVASASYQYSELWSMVQEFPDQLTWTFRAKNQPNCSVVIGPDTYTSQESESVNGLYGCVTSFPNIKTLQRFSSAESQQWLMVESLEGIPAITVPSGSDVTSYSRDCWVAEFEGEEKKVFFYPSASYSDNPITRMVGIAIVRPVNTGLPTPNVDYVFTLEPKEFTFQKTFYSDHWIDLFRYGLLDSYGDTRPWDFSTMDRVKNALGRGLSRGEVFLNGSKSLSELVEAYCKFYGAAVTTTTDGKLTFCAIRKPSASDSSVATLSNSSYTDKPNWSLAEDALCNTVVVKSEGFSNGELVFNNQESKGCYGQGRVIEVDLSTIHHESDFVINQTALVIHLNNRFFDLYAKPYTVATVKTTTSYLNTIFPGSIITVTDWLIPNGEGTRGVSSRKALVFSRKIDLSRATMEFELMLFPLDQDNGYSPCLRVESISGAVLTIGSSYISTGQTGAVTDYAGSNTAGYRYTANDRGIGFFSAGDKVELILRDSTSFSTESFTISSIGATTITLNATPSSSPVDWANEALSGKVDIRFSPFDTSGLTDTQKSYAYIGSATAGKIAGTTTKNKRFKA